VDVGGQRQFVNGLPGSRVPGFVSDSNYHQDMLRGQQEYEKLLSEREQYGVYGKNGHDKIIADAKVLMSMIEDNYSDLLRWGGIDLTPEQRIEYTRRGGSEGHSGNSWACVCEAAFNMLHGEEPFATGLPALNRTVVHL
jgi:hypothetical protein